MSKAVKVFKNIFLGFAIATSSFIIYESCLDSETSAKHSQFAADVITFILDNVFHLKEPIKEVAPTSVYIKKTNYTYNNIDGYEDNEIAIGCTKQIYASVMPDNCTDKNVTFEVEPAGIVNISQNGNYLNVEGINKGQVNIKAISKKDNKLTNTYTFNVVDKVAPFNFETPESITLKKGLSSYVDIKIIESDLKDDPILTNKYYDLSKLTITKLNNNISFENNYVIAKEAGVSSLTISNGIISKSVDIQIEDNPNPIKYPTSFSIKGNDACYINDVDFDRSDKGKHNTPLSLDWGDNVPTDQNVIWSIDKDHVASIDRNGVVRGKAKTSEDDVTFNVTAMSVSDNSVKATFPMICKHVYPTKMKITPSNKINEEGNYALDAGKSMSFSISYEPVNASKIGVEVIVDNEKITVSNNGNNVSIYGKEEGTTVVKISSKYVPQLSESFTVVTTARPIINPGNAYDFAIYVRRYFGGHAFLFLVDAIFIGLYLFLLFYEHKIDWLKYVTPLGSLVATLGIAATSEVCQIFAPGRTPKFDDVLIDMNGAFFGTVILFIAIGIVALVRYIKRKRNKAKEINSK